MRWPLKNLTIYCLFGQMQLVLGMAGTTFTYPFMWQGTNENKSYSFHFSAHKVQKSAKIKGENRDRNIRSICTYPKTIGKSVYFVKIQGMVKGHANGVTQGFSASGVYRIGLLENWRNSSATFGVQNLDQERS